MGRVGRALFFLTFALTCASALADTTLVFLRHGEKPPTGLGQISCQGLNRALALPKVLIGRYGPPDLIYASNPATQKKDYGVKYAYIRPLATIEPTAIRLGLPVNLQFSFDNARGLKDALLSPATSGKTVYIAWEHHLLRKIVRDIIADIDPAQVHKVPQWKFDDFDSIFVLKIAEQGGRKTLSFRHDQQGLNGLPVSCPER